MNRTVWVALAITAAIAALVVAAGSRGPFLGGSREVRTTTHQAPLGELRQMEVDLRMAAGTMTVRTIDGAAAYEATITQDALFNTLVSFRDGRLRITDRAPRRLGTSLTNEWTVALNRRIPIDLEATTGAGRATFDLTGFKGSAEIRAGAGEVRVEFTGPGEPVKKLEFAGGVGRIELIVPAGVGMRIKARGGLNRLRLTGFTQVSDDEYVNGAWSSATARLDVNARLGVGDFVVTGR